MSTLVERSEALAVTVSCTGHELSVVLSDGRTVAVPLAWFPRLVAASPKQRVDCELIGGGIGIHWDAVDEDISVASLLQPENFMRLPNEAYLDSSVKKKVMRRRNPLVNATKFFLRRMGVTGPRREHGSRLRGAHRRRRPKGRDARGATWRTASHR